VGHSVTDIFAKYLKKPDESKAHAKLSASGAERWLNCPGSVKLSEGIPSTSNEASLRGTNTHTLLQFILENPADWGTLLPSHKSLKFRHAIGFDSKMHSNAYFAAKYVWKEKAHMELLYGGKAELFTEKKVELEGVGFGTSDIILYQPYGTLHVMDYKNGTKVVEAKDNIQGLYYTYAAADLFNWEFSKLKITIIQPNAPHTKGQIRTWDVPEDELTRAGIRLKRGALATRKHNAPLVKNDSWCWFCPARPKCPLHVEVRNQKLLERFGVET